VWRRVVGLGWVGLGHLGGTCDMAAAMSGIASYRRSCRPIENVAIRHAQILWRIFSSTVPKQPLRVRGTLAHGSFMGLLQFQ